jgi:hypothetical protein
MDYWQVNLFVDERCADIRREVDSFRLAGQAAPENGWFAQRMLSLGTWLVSVGEDLCQRYDMSKTETALNGF